MNGQIVLKGNEMTKEIKDEEILAYLDGKAEALIGAQIEDSKELLDRAKELARIQNRLTAKLYRHECPDSTELGESLLGLLSNKRGRAIKLHVSGCPHCARELAQLKEFIGTEEANLRAGISEHVKVIIADLVSGIAGSEGRLTPAYGVRGEDQVALVYEADGIQVVIDIHDNSQYPSQKNLLGLITGITAQDYQINLIFKGKSIASSLVDTTGNFIIPEIPAGEYQLIISGPEVEIQILKLKI
jgi:hypothetical protein